MVHLRFRNTTGSTNIALGLFADGNLTTGSNNIDIDNAGVADESTTIRIGTQGTHPLSGAELDLLPWLGRGAVSAMEVWRARTEFQAKKTK
jgi:hypothetical protein